MSVLRRLADREVRGLYLEKITVLLHRLQSKLTRRCGVGRNSIAPTDYSDVRDSAD